jgi:hypothetical protein
MELLLFDFLGVSGPSISPGLLTSLCSSYCCCYNSRRHARLVESYRCLLNMCLRLSVCINKMFQHQQDPH